MVASSASASDPHKVTTPTPIQTLIIGPKVCSAPATLPTFRKIPEPMIEPTTIVTPSNRPSTRGNVSPASVDDGLLKESVEDMSPFLSVNSDKRCRSSLY